MIQYRPTVEEQIVIDELQEGLATTLIDEWSSLEEGQWLGSGEEGQWLGSGEEVPNGELWMSEDTISLVEKAQQYCNACNALLRSVACAYLKLVVGEECRHI